MEDGLDNSPGEFDCGLKVKMRMGVRFVADGRANKMKKSLVIKSGTKVWILRAITTMLLWPCALQLMALGETWGPRLLKGWPSCLDHGDDFLSAQSESEKSFLPTKVLLPPKSEF